MRVLSQHGQIVLKTLSQKHISQNRGQVECLKVWVLSSNPTMGARGGWERGRVLDVDNCSVCLVPPSASPCTGILLFHWEFSSYGSKETHPLCSASSTQWDGPVNLIIMTDSVMGI
jgi:hypothetical protein